MSWFSKLFSVDEAKVSGLLICLFIGFGFALYQYQINGDFSNNLLIILEFLVCGVGGINGVNIISNTLNSNKNISTDILQEGDTNSRI